MTRAIYRSMQGKEIDMDKLVNQNEMTVAVGNVKVNARGDELGPGGKIIRTAEDSVRTENLIPDQNGTPKTQPIIVEKPVVEPTVVAKTKKDVSKMDPEGKE